MERWRISAWLQHLITGLCFFPCKYDFIPAYSSVLMGCGIDWVLQTRAHSSGSKRTASEFLLQDDKRVDFNLDVQNIGYHYVGYESILWVSIVDVCSHLFHHSFLVRKKHVNITSGHHVFSCIPQNCSFSLGFPHLSPILYSILPYLIFFIHQNLFHDSLNFELFFPCHLNFSFFCCSFPSILDFLIIFLLLVTFHAYFIHLH